MSQHYAVIAGIDLGDRYNYLCLLDTENGDVVEESRVATNREAFERHFSGAEPMRVAIETGTHSPWVSRILEDHGHEVLVANARKVRLIYGEGRKTDRIDAEKLARLARLDPKLLSPIKHCGESSQCHLALVHSRDALVGTRTKLVNHVLGARSRPSGLASPNARRKASTTRSPSTCRENSRRLWDRSWRPSRR